MANPGYRRPCLIQNKTTKQSGVENARTCQVFPAVLRAASVTVCGHGCCVTKKHLSQGWSCVLSLLIAEVTALKCFSYCRLWSKGLKCATVPKRYHRNGRHCGWPLACLTHHMPPPAEAGTFEATALILEEDTKARGHREASWDTQRTGGGILMGLFRPQKNLPWL